MSEQAKEGLDVSMWKDIIYKDGKIDEEQVMKELADFSFLMQQASKVYDHVTGGKLSKVMYKAETIIAEADDLFNKTFDENMDEYVKDKMTDTLLAIKEPLAKFTGRQRVSGISNQIMQQDLMLENSTIDQALSIINEKLEGK